MTGFSRVLYFVIWLSLTAFALAQSEKLPAAPFLKFTQLSLDEGLSQSIVECILQDNRGFMWFGTEDGLNQYDGYTFSVLRNDPENPASLSQNHVTAIFQAKNGILWIGAFNGGLNKFNPQTREITIFRAKPTDPTGLCHDIIWDLYEDETGTLWLCTEDGFSEFDPVTEKFSCYFNNPHDPKTLSHNKTKAMCVDNQGYFWIATDFGLNKFDPRAKIFTRFYHDPHNSNTLGYDKLRSIYTDRTGAIWIGTDGGGLDKLTFAANGLPQFSHFINDLKNPASLSHNSVYAIHQDSYGALWIGTKGGGLNLYDETTETFSRYLFDPLDPTSISYNEIYSIYEDNTGVIWLGTYGGGINKVSQVVGQFTHYKSKPNDSNSLNHDIIWSILEDENGILWLGTHGGGLNRFDRVGNLWKHYLADPDKPNGLSNGIVRVVYKDKQGVMWLATSGGGLCRFDPASEKFITYRHNPNDPASLAFDELRCLFEDSRGDFWVGTYGDGLDKFNRQTGHFQHYVNDPNNPNSICNNFIRAIYEDPNGYLWIGTQGGGLNRFDPRTDEFILFKNIAQDSTSIPNDFVFSILGNADGTLWLGTYGGGLAKFAPATGVCERFTQTDGLASNSVYGIVKDDDGNLWLSSNNGISTFNPFNKTFTNYNVDDGLQSTEFNGGAYFKSRSGEIFFGGINGFNCFYPENIRENEHKPPVIITSFKKFNKEVALEKPISDTQQLKLSWKDYLFSFEFAALDFTAPDRYHYAYRMEGLDKEWIYTDATKRFANYTTLPPGHYVFRVIGSNNDNAWNDEGASISITITPPFWETLVFRIFVGFVIAGLLYAAYRWRMSLQQQKRLELEARVAERTDAAHKLQAALSEVERLKNRLQAENVYLQDEIKVVNNFENIITRSQALKKVLSQVEQVAATDATVLILGESGTGKELVARAIHNLSNRSDHILVKVNCSALPANLIESEFFGHEKGAFTGAIAKKIGRFELAHSGTIFLDEIGDLPLELQAKLLRVLQEGEFERVGGTETLKVDVRIIAATNRDLRKEIKDGHFREDLFFRLNVFPIHIPPLRERREDIPLLVTHFVKKYGAKTGKKIDSVPRGVMDMLQHYDWPGNVRELENVIERALITSGNHTLKLGDWLSGPDKAAPTDLVTLEESEKQHIVRALHLTNWRVSGDKGAAKLLGINAKTLESRMKKLSIVKNT